MLRTTDARRCVDLVRLGNNRVRFRVYANEMVNNGDFPEGRFSGRDTSGEHDVTVAECALSERTEQLRLRLALLAEERILAQESGLANDPAYVQDLELEIDTTRVAHDGMVITQLVLLRAQLDGRNWG